MSHSIRNPAVQYPLGTQVVALAQVQDEAGRLLHPYGAVARVMEVASRDNATTEYHVEFLDGTSTQLAHDQLAVLAEFKRGEIAALKSSDSTSPSAEDEDLWERVIFRCVVGSRAYGLEYEESDTDWRGIYLPTADRHWSLAGVPEQLELDESQECYWELQKFLTLALKANPNVLECLYSPMVEKLTPLAGELLEMRNSFLSKLVFQTYSGYVASQFKKTQADLRNHGAVKWKHVMHLVRLLYAGIALLETGAVQVQVGDNRERLLAIKNGELEWDKVNALRLQLQKRFEQAFSRTRLPERPDYQRVNAFLLKARRLATREELP